MHAVVVEVKIEGDFEAARRSLVETVVPAVSGQPGFVAGYWLEPQDGTGLSVVLFDSPQQAEQSAERVRGQSVVPAGVSITRVETRAVVANA